MEVDTGSYETKMGESHRRGIVILKLIYITNRRFVSVDRVSPGPLGHTADQLTKGMAAAQLRLLGIFPFELRPDRVQQLQITLVWPLLQGFDKRQAQGAPRLSILERIRPMGARG